MAYRTNLIRDLKPSKRRRRRSEQVWHTELESIDDIRTLIRNEPKPEHNSYLNASNAEDSHRTKWTGTKSYRDADKLLLSGWEEGRKSAAGIKARMEKLLPAKPDQSFEPEPTPMQDSGEEVDIGEFLSGAPDCWVDFPHQIRPKAGRIIRVVVCGGISCSYSAKAIERRGAVALALIDLLESYGYRTEVLLQFGTARDDKEYHATIVLKEADQPLDLDRLTFAIVHPSMFRRVVFAVFERCPIPIGGTYGTPTNLPKELTQEGDLVLGAALAKESTDEEAVEALLEIAKEYIEIDL